MDDLHVGTAAVFAEAATLGNPVACEGLTYAPMWLEDEFREARRTDAPEERTCPVCDRWFVVEPDALGRPKEYCSKACANRHSWRAHRVRVWDGRYAAARAAGQQALFG